MFEMPDPPTTISLVGHEVMRPQLEAKLAEYRQRTQDASRTDASRVDAAHKTAVLSRLLAAPDGQIVVEDTKLLVYAELGSSFSSWDYANACNVVNGYIVGPATGTAMRGGTGLPKLP